MLLFAVQLTSSSSSSSSWDEEEDDINNDDITGEAMGKEAVAPVESGGSG
ncbi:hypothetical protein ACHAXM_002993, partial [Skeletonema potamos]